MRCPGDCNDMCEDGHEVEECLLNVHCQGNCQNKCTVENKGLLENKDGSSLQLKQGSTHSNMSYPDQYTGAGMPNFSSDDTMDHSRVQYNDSSETGSSCVYNVHIEDNCTQLRFWRTLNKIWMNVYGPYTAQVTALITAQ